MFLHLASIHIFMIYFFYFLLVIQKIRFPPAFARREGGRAFHEDDPLTFPFYFFFRASGSKAKRAMPFFFYSILHYLIRLLFCGCCLLPQKRRGASLSFEP